MAKETVGLKLDSELAKKFKELQGVAGGTAQDFIEILLSAHAERQVDTDTASPIYKELVKVKQIFAQGERVVSSFLELAAHDKIEAEAKAQELVKDAQGKIVTLDETVILLENENKEYAAKLDEQSKSIVVLEDQAESVQALREAWAEKENTLNTRIAELDAEAKESRDLKIKILDLENLVLERNGDITHFEQQIALATQKAESDQAIIADLKKSHGFAVADLKEQVIAESRRMDEAKQDYKDALEDLKGQQKIALEKLEKDHFNFVEAKHLSDSERDEEHRQLAESIQDLDKQLTETKVEAAETKGRLASMEALLTKEQNDNSSLKSENLGMKTNIETLKDELKKKSK